ncbi:MAG: hypothetical protein WC143_00380 [Eubacteriales bacterium]
MRTAMYNAESAEKFEFPAIILNEKQIIIAKNKAAGARCSPFRRGSGIGRYLNKADKAALSSLLPGMHTVVTLSGLGYIPAIVFFDGKNYLVKTNVMATELNKRLESLCELQQKGLITLGILSSPSVFEKPGAGAKVKHALYVQYRISEYISLVIGSSPTPRQPCDIGKMFQSVCGGAKTVLSHINADILCIDESKGAFVFAGKRDLEYMLFTCISLCFMLSEGNRIDARLSYREKRVIASFCFDDFKSPELVKNLEKRVEESDFSGSDGEAALLLSYARAICEYQNAALSLKRLPSKTKALITLTLPGYPCREEGLFEDIDSSPESGDILANADFALAGVLVKRGDGE